MAACHGTPSALLAELADVTATLPAYLVVSIGPYRVNLAVWTSQKREPP